MKLFICLFATVALAAPSAAADQTFVGVVSDQMCALDHGAMRMGPTDAECAKACVEDHGTSYVLVNGEQVYPLSDQRAPMAFAGQKVKVVGTLDPVTHVITVTSISAADDGRH